MVRASLFEWLTGEADPAPPHNGTPTSRAAAVAIAPDAKTLRGQVYTYLAKQKEHGATDEEMQLALQMDGNTQRPRRQELEKLKLVVDSGSTRTTSSGRAAVVWVCKEYAQKEEHR